MQIDWREQARLGSRFILKLVLFSLLIYGGLLLIKPMVESITAWGSSLVLVLLGIKSWSSGNLVMFTNQTAKIIELCTGSMELSLLLGAVLATEDRTWRQKAWGVVFSIASLYIINIVRVGVTLASAVWFGWKFAELIHTVLFKFFLVFAILGLYALWYIWIPWPVRKKN